MFDYLKFAKKVFESEIDGLNLIKNNLPKDFEATANAISNLKGRLVVSGIGKSGYIGQKISASFASTGTRSFYVHPAEASHGDLGMIGDDDIVLLLSNSGETKELLDIINYCKRFSIPIIGMTMQVESLLAKNSKYILSIPQAKEASSVNAPTTSSTMMLALGDALMVAVHESKSFSKEDFAVNHPGGKLGAALITVENLMHEFDQLPKAKIGTRMSEAIIEMTSKGFGCVAVLSEESNILGIITDGDLRRKMSDHLMLEKVEDVMTKDPIVIDPKSLCAEALSIMSQRNITSILVADNNRILKGIVHIHDLLRVGVK